MFSSMHLNVHILPNGMGRTRVKLFADALMKNGANILDDKKLANFNVSNEKLFIIVDETSLNEWEPIEKIIAKKICKNITEFQVIKSIWLSECLKKKTYVDFNDYEIKKPIEMAATGSCDLNVAFNTEEDASKYNNDSNSYKSKRALSNDESFTLICNNKLMKNDYKYDDSETDSYKSAVSSMEESEDEEPNNNIKKPRVSASYTCAHSSKEQKINFNKDITDKLEELCSIYQNTKDKYRALGYQKAIAALKQFPKRISNWEEVKSIRGVGKRLAQKIMEIMETGELQKLDELNSREDLNAIKLFTNMHGVGPTTAHMFVSQGFRTLDDLKSNANLNKQQTIGLKYYHEFLQRIPRDEVQEIEAIVNNTAWSINPGYIIETCGSYRRGKATCGDVDILITHPDGHSHKGVFHKLINVLHEQNFLTDDLVRHEESGNQTKYLGVCCLSGENRLHRRLDIIVVPYDEYACALLYFTGSAHFNRSMRLLSRKNGMSLSEHSLNKNVIRKGTEKINNGEILPTPTEESIFKHLNLTYRKPEERDF